MLVHGTGGYASGAFPFCHGAFLSLVLVIIQRAALGNTRDTYLERRNCGISSVILFVHHQALPRGKGKGVERRVVVVYSIRDIIDTTVMEFNVHWRETLNIFPLDCFISCIMLSFRCLPITLLLLLLLLVAHGARRP